MLTRSRWPLHVARTAGLGACLAALAILLLEGTDHGHLALAVYPCLLFGNALNWVSISLSKGWHPAVEPTGTALQPRTATAEWPVAFPLTRVWSLDGRRFWSRRRRRSSRLVLRPGWLWVDRHGDPFGPPGPGAFRPDRPAASVVLCPHEVRLVQPLVSRRGRTGLVVHRHGGGVVFLYGDQPREAMLTAVAAAGFAVDGQEQVVSRRWAATPSAARARAAPG